MKKVCRIMSMVLCIVLMLCNLSGCGIHSKLTADYENPGAVATAFDNGETVKGKTVLVTATMDSTGGVIYHAPDMKHKANISVMLVIEEVTKGEVLTLDQVSELTSADDPILHVKEGETVVVKIDTMYALTDFQYTIIGTFVEKSK